MTFIGWTLVALALFPIWGALVWEIWEGLLLPRMIPRVQIGLLADEMTQRYRCRAREMACIHERRAWCDGDMFERGRWRRVRKEIENRQRKVRSMG
jgi:hypothetical protein